MKISLLVLVGAVVASLPSATAGPLVCTSTCTIQGGSLGFVPPVQGLESGVAVKWVANDGTPHLNLEALSPDPCFEVLYNEEDASSLVQFDIVGATLEATTEPGTLSAVTKPCLGAQVLPNGSFVLSYFCGLHPILMKGALVVVP